ncbi:hypothetical protein HY409_02460 [Candidatus Gottesmanbacteria bacterium]|nr:hypothetical protein [Candidatus Gottesmanbacteria bacterium]
MTKPQPPKGVTPSRAEGEPSGQPFVSQADQPLTPPNAAARIPEDSPQAKDARDALDTLATRATPSDIPDDLADFFTDSPGTALDTEQILKDVQEARRDPYERRREINQAVADPEHAITKKARALGASLWAHPGDEAVVSEAVAFLGENMRVALQEPGQLGVGDMIGLLKTELGELESGQRSIYRKLSDFEATAEVGAERRTGQQTVTATKATLLSISEAAFQSEDLTANNLHLAISAFEAAQVDMISAEPVWAVDTMARAIEKADINNPAIRHELVGMKTKNILQTTMDMDARAKDEQPEALTAREIILKRSLEAQHINDQIKEAARLEAERVANAEKLARALERKMAAAVSDGMTQFSYHFTGGDDYPVRFTTSSDGSGILRGVLEDDYQMFGEVSQNHSLGGVNGYLQVLENILETPGFEDRLVEKTVGKYWSDPAGKSREDYKREGRENEWNMYMQQQVRIEVYGNALGILFGAVNEEGPHMSEDRRALILRRSLEVLGGGRSLEQLISGRGELSPEMKMVRKTLTEYIKNPFGREEKKRDDSESVAARRKGRLRTLKDYAAQADTSVSDRRRRKQEELRQKQKEKEERRDRLTAKRTKSQEALRAIEKVRVDMRALKEKAARLGQLSYAPVEEFITVTPNDNAAGDPLVDVAINEDRFRMREQEIAQLREQLTAEHVESPDEMRATLARLETDQEFVQAMRPSVQRVNGPAYQGTKEQRGGFLGVGKKRLGAIAATAFDEIKPLSKQEELPTYFSREIDDSQRSIFLAPERAKTLDDLRGALEIQLAADDVTVIAGDIETVEAELSGRRARGATRFEKHRNDLSNAVKGAARVYVKDQLYQALYQQHRISST